MGGDAQPQIHAQVVSALVDGGVDVATAVGAPRWFVDGDAHFAPPVDVRVGAALPAGAARWARGAGPPGDPDDRSTACSATAHAIELVDGGPAPTRTARSPRPRIRAARGCPPSGSPRRSNRPHGDPGSRRHANNALELMSCLHDRAPTAVGRRSQDAHIHANSACRRSCGRQLTRGRRRAPDASAPEAVSAEHRRQRLGGVLARQPLTEAAADYVRRAGASPGRRRRAPERAHLKVRERGAQAATQSSGVPARQLWTLCSATGGGLRSHDAATGLPPSPAAWSRRVTSNVGQNYPYTSETEAERAAGDRRRSSRSARAGGHARGGDDPGRRATSAGGSGSARRRAAPACSTSRATRSTSTPSSSSATGPAARPSCADRTAGRRRGARHAARRPTMTTGRRSRRRLVPGRPWHRRRAAGFGFVYGLTARTRGGFSPVEASAMSLIAFAGPDSSPRSATSSQACSWPVIAVLTFLLNARHVLYSAALAPWFRGRLDSPSAPLRRIS